MKSKDGERKKSTKEFRDACTIIVKDKKYSHRYSDNCGCDECNDRFNRILRLNIDTNAGNDKKAMAKAMARLKKEVA